MSDIKVGDVVKLKSGGVAMSLASIFDGIAYCQWQDGAKALSGTYAVVILQLYNPEEDDSQDCMPLVS